MLKKEYKITEDLANLIEEVSAFEDMVVSLSKRARTTRKEFWKGVYLLHPELDTPEIKLSHSSKNKLFVTVA